MKLTRSPLALLVVAASLSLVSVVRAGTGCPDDPERCVERGASVRRAVGATASAASLTSAPALASPAAPAVSSKPPIARKPVRVTRTARPTTHAPATSAPTPGMGMLLKLSVGSSGESAWSAARPSDPTTGTSWIL